MESAGIARGDAGPPSAGPEENPAPVDYSGEWTVCPGCGSDEPDHCEDVRSVSGRCIFEDVDQ